MVLCFLVSGGTSSCPGNSAIVAEAQSSTLEQQSPCRVSPRVTIMRSSGGSSNNSNREPNSESSSNCLPSETSSPGNKHPATGTAPRRAFPAYDRLEILSPESPLKLAEENELSLRIHGAGLTTLGTIQTQFRGGNPEMPDSVHGSKQSVQVLHHPDGSPYINIVPMRLGKLQLTLDGLFPDGGAVLKKILVDVEPSHERPDKLLIGSLGALQRNATTIFVGLDAFRTPTALDIYAKYGKLGTTLLIDPSFARFRITTLDRTSPVRLDERTGSLTPVHPGQALLETTFGGRINLTCVIVDEAHNPDRGDFGRNCQQILASGEKLGSVD